MSVHRSMSIVNESKNLSKVRAIVLEVLDASTFTREDRNKIVVAVDEALANVVEHAYGGDQGMVDLDFSLDDQHLRVQIRDNGLRFNPGEKLSTPIDIHDHIKKGLKGGLGLFLMRRIMDEVQFNHDGTDFVNELVMIKKVPPPDEEGEGSPS